jgi:hypothetical protein
MVGGIVIETLDTGDRLWINVRVSGPGYAECAIYVERTDASRSVSVGDRVRWEAGRAYWTPKGAPFRDWTFVRVGPAGADRPAPVSATSTAMYVGEEGG